MFSVVGCSSLIDHWDSVWNLETAPDVYMVSSWYVCSVEVTPERWFEIKMLNAL